MRKEYNFSKGTRGKYAKLHLVTAFSRPLFEEAKKNLSPKELLKYIDDRIKQLKHEYERHNKLKPIKKITISIEEGYNSDYETSYRFLYVDGLRLETEKEMQTRLEAEVESKEKQDRHKELADKQEQELYENLKKKYEK